jgi:nucleotide-binding universal stress UspA family protein
VTMVRVCDLASHNGFELCVRTPQEIAEEHLGIAQERLVAFLNTEFTGCERVLRSGDAAEEIAEVARSGACDLIFMRRTPAGSVACCWAQPRPRC